jgi:hypothetical protein
MRPKAHVYDTRPTAIDEADARLEFEDLTQAYIAVGARVLLLHPEVNAHLVGRGLVPAEQQPALLPTGDGSTGAAPPEFRAVPPKPDGSRLEDVLQALAPHDLRFFSLDGRGQDSFEVAQKQVPAFFDGLLRRAAQECARLAYEAAFKPTANDANTLTEFIHAAVTAAFQEHAPDVPARGRESYTGIVMTALGLTPGGLGARQAYERVHKALFRSQRS